jgi:hypothetical protein
MASFPLRSETKGVRVNEASWLCPAVATQQPRPGQFRCRGPASLRLACLVTQNGHRPVVPRPHSAVVAGRPFQECN